MCIRDRYKGEELIEQCRLHADDLVPKHIIVDDILASVNYMNGLAVGLSTKDDICLLYTSPGEQALAAVNALEGLEGAHQGEEDGHDGRRHQQG